MVSIVVPFVLVLTSFSQTAEGAGEDTASFAKPIRLTAGDAPMGQGRMYPSPALHDLDGDGVPEMILGDLPGVLTFSKRLPGGDQLGWSAPEDMKSAKGERLKFNNW